MLADMLDYQSVGEMLGGKESPMSVRQIQRLVKSGRLKSVRMGYRTVRFRKCDVQSFIFKHLS